MGWAGRLPSPSERPQGPGGARPGPPAGTQENLGRPGVFLRAPWFQGQALRSCPYRA